MPSRVWTFGSRSGCTSAIIAGGAALSMLLTGCASSGSGDESTPSSASAPQPGNIGSVSDRATPFLELGYRLNWAIGDTSAPMSRAKMIDVVDDLVLVHDQGNSITAREVSNGETRWAANLGTPLTKFVGNVRIGDRVVSASESELLILDADTGRLDDRQRLAVLSNTSPAIADGYMLIFGTAKGEVFGHDIRVGLKRWGFALNQRIKGDPIMIGQIAGAVAESGQVLLVNPANGEAIAPLQQIYGGLENDPVTDGVNLYIASSDQSIYAFESTTGQLLWRVRTQSRLVAQPTVHNGVLYQDVPSEGLIAVNTRTGKRIWANPDVSGTVIAERKGELLVWDGSEAVLIDPASGDERERVALPGVREIIANGFVDGELIVLSGDSALARFSSR